MMLVEEENVLLVVGWRVMYDAVVPTYHDEGEGEQQRSRAVSI